MKYLLFTTTTCPNCPPMKEFVKTLPFDGEVIDNTKANFQEGVKKFGIQKAPTLIVFDGEEKFRATETEEAKEKLAF